MAMAVAVAVAAAVAVAVDAAAAAAASETVALCVVAPLNFLYARERLPKLSSCASIAVYLCVHTYVCVCLCVTLIRNATQA